MRIDRCICFNRTFADLVACARREGISDVESLRARESFGLNCALCVPYVRRALETGEVVFDRILVDEPVGRTS